MKLPFRTRTAVLAVALTAVAGCNRTREVSDCGPALLAEVVPLPIVKAADIPPNYQPMADVTNTCAAGEVAMARIEVLGDGVGISKDCARDLNLKKNAFDPGADGSLMNIFCTPGKTLSIKAKSANGVTALVGACGDEVTMALTLEAGASMAVPQRNAVKKSNNSL